MKKLLALSMVYLLCSCHPPKVPVPHKYSYGEKVLLKTGDIAVVIEYPWYNLTTTEGYPKTPEYIVRVAFVKRASKTDSLLNGMQTRHTDIGKFTVYEYEIEKKIK